MEPKDINYLSLQFLKKIFTCKGSEFQSLFENIMQKADPDFEKVRPYGKDGDGGNDGFNKKKGIYYQVYAPIVPFTKESDAAKKLVEDFEKLKATWGNIVPIKKYYFVYNDQYGGSTIRLEKAISQLQTSNISIEFEILNAKKIESICLKLSDSDLIFLGFDVDSRKSLDAAYLTLEQIEILLDRETISLADQMLSYIRPIILFINEDRLQLDYEILESRCLQKMERVPEAKLKYEILSKRNFDDPRPTLYLAEIALQEKDYTLNQKLLQSVNQPYWLLDLELLVRKSNLQEFIDLANIDESAFPYEPKAKSSFYRLYSLFLHQSGDLKKANYFIEKAIHLNPNRLSNYDVKLSFGEDELLSSMKSEDIDPEIINIYLNEIENFESMFAEYGEIRERSQANLLSKKLIVFVLQKKYYEYDDLVIRVLDLLIKCYYDINVEQILLKILWGYSLSRNHLTKLINFLYKTDIEISYRLSEILLIQFNFHDTLFTEGRIFFNEKKNYEYLTLINKIESKKYDEVVQYFKNKTQLAIAFVNTARNSPELRKVLIESLPDNPVGFKDKLLIYMHYEENKYDEAFELLKKLDLKTVSVLECPHLIQIAHRKEAWDLEIQLIRKSLEYEYQSKIKLNLKLQLFNAYYNLNDYLMAIVIGEELLAEESNKDNLNFKNKESLLAQTIQAHLKRGQVYEAYVLMTNYNFLGTSTEFKISISTEVFLKNNMPTEALNSIIDGVKIKKRLSQEEYASLFFYFTQIENLIKFNIIQLEKVNNDCFVKIKNEERWYYIGENEELDASKISIDDELYSSFIGKKTGDNIVIPNKYSPNDTIKIIEFVLSIDRYILWQSSYYFNKLTIDKRWTGAIAIEVPEKNGSIDTQYLVAFFEDESKKLEPFFEMYCKNNFPLAMLALNDGGLPNAISHIKQENKGFIRFSSGTLIEFEKQKDLAKKVIDENLAFFIDGTSALFLSEIGVFKKIYKYVPSIKVPQSVISMLLAIRDRFRVNPGEKGSIGYAQGQLRLSSIEQENYKLIIDNFNSCIALLESKKENVISISNALKIDVLSENKIHPELCDACILSQKEHLPILTDDFLYLQLNNLETKKEIPQYFSSIALVRVLYESGKISFDEYLDYFGYLSYYRLSFLTLNSEDIYTSIFGDGSVFRVNIQNLHKFNFPLTLSEEYGVNFKTSLTVIIPFLLKIIMDDTIPSNIVENIYLELLLSFPTAKNKKDIGRLFISICNQTIKNEFTIILASSVQDKLIKLSEINEMYNFNNSLWVPGKK